MFPSMFRPPSNSAKDALIWRVAASKAGMTLAVPQEPAVMCCGTAVVSPIWITSLSGSMSSSRNRTAVITVRIPCPISCPETAKRVVPSAPIRSVAMLALVIAG